MNALPIVRTARNLVATLATAAVLLSLPSSAAAQQFDPQFLRPAASQQTNYFGLHSAEILRGGQWELGAFFSYADDQLVVETDGGDRLGSIIGRQATMNILGAIGVADLLEIGVDIPVVLFQDGDEIPGIDAADGGQGGAGIGNVRLIPVFTFFDRSRDSAEGGAALALIVDLILPSGRGGDWQGDGFRAAPSLAFDYAFRKGVRLTLSGGMLFRPMEELENLAVANAVTWGAGVDIPIGKARAFHIISEIQGAATVAGRRSGDREELPIEGRVGVRYITRSGVGIQAGTGTGLTGGAGSPDWRVFAGVSFARPIKPEEPEEVDLCPGDPDKTEPGVCGCGTADTDTDGDGVLDCDDACPNDPDKTEPGICGCGTADTDTDGDGTADCVDLCPEDPDKTEPGVCGCGEPDIDSDGDGILDCNDACPHEAEDFDGFEDDDGCPEEGGNVVRVTCDAIEIAESVHFDTDSDVIQSRSHSLLDQVANILQRATFIQLVRVEGHTDSRGSDAHNLDLSQRRADSVRRYLIQAGISPPRLEAVGFGEAQPIAENTTVEGRAQNRRVDFRIVRRDDACE